MTLLYKIIKRIYFFKIEIKISYIFHKYFFGTVIRKVNNYKMYLDLKNDSGISKELFIYKKREYFSTDFLLNSNIIRKNDIILDIGANIGYYALLESGLTGKNGQVYAIEPVYKNIKNLKRNIKLNNIKNIKVFKLAAGDQNTKIDIFIHEKCNLSSAIKRRDKKYIGKEEVKMIKIDDFVEKKKIKPSLVRMDVEGYEYKVLEGMATLMKKIQPNLLIEFHPHILNITQKKYICGILKEHYAKATIIRDMSPKYLTLEGKVRPVLKYLNKKIKKTKNISTSLAIIETSIQELCNQILNSKQAFHALISGNRR